MRTIGTVVLVLIAGMSRSTSAQLRIDPTRSSDMDNCRLDENLENCYGPVWREFEETRRGIGAVDAAIAMYCGRTEILENCLRSLGETKKLCQAGLEEYVFIDPIINVTTLMSRFPCAHPELIKDFFNTTDLRCIASKQRTVENCSRRIFSDHPVSVINPQELDTGFYNNRTCSNILAAQQCAVTVLEDCEDKRFSTTLDSLFKYINNDIPCENLPKSPKTQVSPAQA